MFKVILFFLYTHKNTYAHVFTDILRRINPYMENNISPYTYIGEKGILHIIIGSDSVAKWIGRQVKVWKPQIRAAGLNSPSNEC